MLVTSNLPFDEWTSIFGSERLTGALLDRLTHHDDLKHKLAGRIVRVEIHIQDAKGDALRLQPINDFAQMPDRARQAVNFRENQRRSRDGCDAQGGSREFHHGASACDARHGWRIGRND